MRNAPIFEPTAIATASSADPAVYHRDGAAVVLGQDEHILAECDHLEDAELIARTFKERNRYLAAVRRVEGLLSADYQRDFLTLQHMVRNVLEEVHGALKEPVVETRLPLSLSIKVRDSREEVRVYDTEVNGKTEIAYQWAESDYLEFLDQQGEPLTEDELADIQRQLLDVLTRFDTFCKENGYKPDQQFGRAALYGMFQAKMAEDLHEEQYGAPGMR